MGRTNEQFPFEPEEKQEKARYRFNKSKFIGFILSILVIAGIGYCGYLFLSENEDVFSAYAGGGKKPAASSAETGIKQKDAGTGGKWIVVDAGHGGMDCGAIGVSGVHEDTLNLKVAKHLQTALEKQDYGVIMTRKDENAIADTKNADMTKRREIINGSDSDIVVSIHMNSHTDPGTSGPIVFFMQGSAQGEKLAKCIQESLNNVLDPRVKNNARSDDFFILKSGNQPCALVECGFISNAKEEALLKKESYQSDMAEAICKGVTAYFEN